MANPTAYVKSKRSAYYPGGAVQADQFLDAAGNVIGAAQQAHIADLAAPTAYSAHASGSTPVTSNAATDLDTTAAALATLRGEVAAVVTKVNAVLAALENAGILADS